MGITLRAAKRDDLPEILAIYNEAVLNTTASYDYDPSTLEMRTRWFEDHEALGLPILVAVTDTGKVAGWGSLSRFRERIGYQYSVEHSVYVAADCRRQGIGRVIVAELIAQAKALGKHVLIGGVDADTEASVALHRRLGFEEVARFREVGYKFDGWRDVIFFQMFL